MPLRLDKNSPTRTQPPQRVVQPAGDAYEFSRHSGIQVRSPKPCRALERAILVEDDALIDQSGPGQEIRKLGGRTPVFGKVHHA